MLFKRQIHDKVAERAQKMPVIALLGPRQSGKTTLAKMVFPNHAYVSLENFDIRDLAVQDPKKFLATVLNDYGVIIDEVQHAPRLLSYIQTYVDEQHRPGNIVITGSQNLLVNEAVSQTLAGRVALFTLLPFSIAELKEVNALPETLEQLVYKGQYPRIYAHDLESTAWYLDYIQTYVERDVRQISNIIDLATFRKFLALCAGRVGQLLNIAALATECGIDQRTAKAWLSVLEATYIVFLLQPHHQNFNKRLTKSPKLYFYDTGLACALLNIQSPYQLATHFARGALVECLVISEIFKHYYNHGQRPNNVYFWQNHTGNEVDCVIQKGNDWVPVEIKAGMTVVSQFFTGLEYWNKLTNYHERGYVIYSGDSNQQWPLGTVVSWRNIEDIFT